MKNSVNRQVRILKALASESRLEIIRLLAEHPQCVNAIAERLRMTQPAVSQQLRILREAGLIKAEKRGVWIHYAVDPETMKACGRDMARIFGGWVELRGAGRGKAGCPPGLLKECRSGKKRPDSSEQEK
jgi:ArsR family transcriptional regulator, arsenate/arsenite/antimonite-responsive transcriptional repressor